MELVETIAQFSDNRHDGKCAHPGSHIYKRELLSCDLQIIDHVRTSPGHHHKTSQGEKCSCKKSYTVFTQSQGMP